MSSRVRRPQPARFLSRPTRDWPGCRKSARSPPALAGGSITVLISNGDDHLRNHAFLYTGASGWRLSPAYDLNPIPTDIKPRILSTSIDLIDPAASIDLALDVAAYFDLEPRRAREIASEVGAAVASWKQAAALAKVKHSEIERMASAFEHEDLRKTLR